MVSFFTALGDDGTTGLLKEGRVPKNDPIPSALGAIDEANAALGLARASSQSPLSQQIIVAVQRDLYLLMAEVSASPENAASFSKIGSEKVAWLEARIDSLGETIQMPREFIVPGDSYSAAAFDLARTVVRRAERHLVGLVLDQIVLNLELIRYLNRLSTLCFVLELAEIQLSRPSSPTLARQG